MKQFTFNERDKKEIAHEDRNFAADILREIYRECDSDKVKQAIKLTVKELCEEEVA